MSENHRDRRRDVWRDSAPFWEKHREIIRQMFVPRQTDHYVEYIGDKPLQYIYVSIWPGTIPAEDGLSWRDASEAMIRMYDTRGYSPQRSV